MILPPAAEAESTRRTRIKICGITSAEMAMVAVDAGADAIGLVQVESSPRYVTPEQAREIASEAPLDLQVVSVFQNLPLTHAAEWAREIVQLHGEEDETYVKQLRAERPNVRVIRALAFDAAAVRRWNDCDDVDALLIEGSAAGTGETFSHEELAAMMAEIRKPVILAGGLAPSNVGDAIRAVHPFGVDVSSGVERERGVKDEALIRAFCETVRGADAR